MTGTSAGSPEGGGETGQTIVTWAQKPPKSWCVYAVFWKLTADDAAPRPDVFAFRHDPGASDHDGLDVLLRVRDGRDRESEVDVEALAFAARGTKEVLMRRM